MALTALAFHGLARAESCATLSIQGASKECGSVLAQFGVSGCQDEISGSVKISCKDGRATIKATGKQNRYEASLRYQDGSWGGQAWTQDGEISVIPRHQKKDAPAAAAASAPQMRSRAPASEQAEEASEPKVVRPAPKAASALQAGSWSFTAIFDSYYAYNFNRPTPPTAITSTSVDAAAVRPAQNGLRYYDWYSRQLGLNLVEFSPKYTRRDVSLLVDFDFGLMADINAASAAGSGYVVDEVSKHIGQAVLSYSPSKVPGLVIEVGKMATHVGLEVIKAKDNWNYSRSVNFGFGIPLWHTGVHVGYGVIPEKLTASVYLYNGWNTMVDVNSSPTIGAQLKFVPNENMSFLYNYIGGSEQAGNNSNTKMVHEANATVSVHQNLAFGLEMLSGSEQNASVSGSFATAKWYGASLAAKWQAGKSYVISPRVEFFRDEYGYMVGSGGQTIKSYTLTNSFQIADGMETRLE
ncbi:MAG: porin, partial [Bdellovibrionales bacterium]|nr:porin [Bdellovibrionales bacterium]